MIARVVSSVSVLAAAVAVIAVLLARTLPDAADVSLRLQDLPQRKDIIIYAREKERERERERERGAEREM